jgi:hypothetical protein
MNFFDVLCFVLLRPEAYAARAEQQTDVYLQNYIYGKAGSKKLVIFILLIIEFWCW